MIPENHLDIIYNTINDVIFILDVEEGTRFRFKSINDSFLISTGLTKDRVLGKYIQEVIPSESLQLVVSKYLEAIETKSSVSWEEISVYPRGEKTGVVTVTPLFDILGECTQMVGSVHDITNQKLQEKKIQIANEDREKVILDLIAKNKDLEQFTYIVSHNLRAPIANLLGLARILDHGDINEQDQQEIIAGITTSVKKLDDVVTDLNTILQQREPNKREKIYFQQIVNDICISIKHIIDEEDVKINTGFNGIESIYSIRSYIYSIFNNLIVNSIKYCIHNIPPIIDIEFLLEHDNVKIIFTDNGKGMDMNKHGKDLFGLYKRFDKTVTGKGMGLYLVKTQVEALRGSITASSHLNQGMQFIITLPVN